jgi:hypothetical protein
MIDARNFLQPTAILESQLVCNMFLQASIFQYVVNLKFVPPSFPLWNDPIQSLARRTCKEAVDSNNT